MISLSRQGRPGHISWAIQIQHFLLQISFFHRFVYCGPDQCRRLLLAFGSNCCNAWHIDIGRTVTGDDDENWWRDWYVRKNLIFISVDSKALSKYVATIFYAETFRSNLNTLSEQHQYANGMYRKTLDNWNKIIFIISKSLLVMYMGAVLIFALIPLAFYVVNGQLQLAIEIVLPYLDPKADRTFYINLTYQIYSLIFACAGISSIDGMFVFYSFQGLAMIQTTRMSFREFGERLNATDELAQQPLVVKNQLRQVLERYTLMQRWIFASVNPSHTREQFNLFQKFYKIYFVFFFFLVGWTMQLFGRRCIMLFDGIIGSRWRHIT